MKNLNKSITITIVLLLGVGLLLLQKNNKTPTSEQTSNVDPILSETHKIDKKITDGDITWVAIDVKRNDKDDTRNYEIWRFDKNKKQPLLMENFWLSSPFGNTIELNLNEKGGLNVNNTESGSEGAATTYITYDKEGLEQLKIVSGSFWSKNNSYFMFHQKGSSEVKVSSLIEGTCKDGQVPPEVTLKGVMLSFVKNSTKDFIFAKPEKLKCIKLDGSLIPDAGVKILKFDNEHIEFSFENGQNGKIILKPYPDQAEVSLQ